MLYPRVLQDQFSAMPMELQRFHAVTKHVTYRGSVTVEPASALSRSFLRYAHVPLKRGTRPLTIRVTRDEDEEIWERNFGDGVIRSVQTEYEPGLIKETIGSSEFLIEPLWQDGRLTKQIIDMRSFGVTVPMWSFRHCSGFEEVSDDGRIHFDMHIHHRIFGRVARYYGTLDEAV